MGRYVDMYYDDSVDRPGGWTPEKAVDWKVANIIQYRKMALCAHDIPRRLGGGATGRQLADDKRNLRRISHVLLNVYGWWSSQQPHPMEAEWREFGPTTRRDAAQVVLGEWVVTMIRRAEKQRSIFVTCAVDGGFHTWANRSANLLGEEIRNWERILKKME